MEPYFKVDKLVVDYRAREWCLLPYPDHPIGCPNYNHRATCPPKIPLVEDYFDLSEPIWLAVIMFDLRSHIERMSQAHPSWSDRQLRCVLYWQAKVNKELESLARRLAQQKGQSYTLCPEAMGVQVIKTAKAVGIPIKPRPTDTIFKIALIATAREHVLNTQASMDFVIAQKEYIEQ